MYDRRIVRGNTYAQRTLPAVGYQTEIIKPCYILPLGWVIGTCLLCHCSPKEALKIKRDRRQYKEVFCEAWNKRFLRDNV